MREKRKGGKGCAAKRIRKWQDPSIPQSASVLLMWIQANTAPFSRLCLNVTREVTSYLSVPVLLPGVYEGRLYVVNVQSRQYHSTPISTAEFGKAAFFPIDHVTVVCMKEGNGSWTACLLDLSALTFTELLPTYPFHYCVPLVCYVSGVLYFFQGSDKDSEKYTIEARSWTALSNIHIYCDLRFTFAVKESIYIGIWGDPMCYRVFDLASEQLGPATPLVPSPRLTCNSIIVRSDEQFLALSFDWMKQMVELWSWDWHKQEIQLRKGNKVYWKCPSTSGFTLRIGKELYWLDKEKPEVHSFNMEKLARQWRKLSQELQVA